MQSAYGISVKSIIIKPDGTINSTIINFDNDIWKLYVSGIEFITLNMINKYNCPNYFLKMQRR